MNDTSKKSAERFLKLQKSQPASAPAARHRAIDRRLRIAELEAEVLSLRMRLQELERRFDRHLEQELQID